ncbi:MAG TPA: NUDIX hydrolase [Stellaceae bacterium]|nr:NUDIX hydrolase [Stellaceae bacterium]
MSDPSSRYYPERPFACALAVCRRGGRVFLARRSMGPGIGRWGFPGGMQELGETIEAGAARELLEETGVAAEPVRIIGGSNVIGRDDDGRVRAHFTLIAVLLDWRAGEGEPIEDASEVGWFTLEEAQALDTFPDALPLMRLALAG